MRKRTIPLALLLMVALLPGCWDKTAIEDTGYVAALGIDAAGPSEWYWGFAIAKPTSFTSARQGAPAEQGLSISRIMVRSPSLVSALQTAQASYGRVLTLSQMRYVIIGEEAARRGVRPVISQLRRHNEVRMNIGVTVVRGKAMEVQTHFLPAIDVDPLKIQEGLLLVQKRYHLTPPIRLQHFAAQQASDGEDPILPLQAFNPKSQEPYGNPLPLATGHSATAGELDRAGGNPVELVGTSVFHHDKLVDFLTIDETMGLLALRGSLGKVYASLPDPLAKDQWVSIRYGQENKPQLRASFNNGRPAIHVKLQLEGEILSVPSGIGYTVPENRRILEDAVTRYWEEEIYRPMLDRVYSRLGADPVGFGNAFRMRFPTHKAWEDYHWLDHAKDLQVTVEVMMFIRRFGMILDVAQ